MKDLIQTLNDILQFEDVNQIRKGISPLRDEILSSKKNEITLMLNGDTEKVNISFLTGEFEQILKTRTIERTKYYISRLIKSLSEIKPGKVNDLNLNRWKEYIDIITDSLWVLDKRDKSGAHNAGYWGNFIPQIPNQLLRRYTKKNEWVLDPFLGSGTTLIECKRLGRNGLGIELQPEVTKIAKENIAKENNPYKINTAILNGDSTAIDIKKALNKLKIKSVQFVIMHPPYWDIIKFSDKKNDLSNAESVESFLSMFSKVSGNALSVLDKGRYFAVIIGDKYSSGEWIPLGFYLMNDLIKKGYKLKSTIVKNFDETKGKMNQKELWRYRALAGGFYIFKHEYIFLFQK
jgi:DNA modification methylase